MPNRSVTLQYLSLGSLLRQARHKRNLHPSAVVMQLGYSDCRMIEKIESGRMKVSLADLPLLARALELHIDDLLEVAEGYHPGLVEMAREIGEETFDCEVADQLLVAIILGGIENRITQH